MCPYVEVGSAPLRLTLLCASPASGFTTLCVVPVCASSLPSPPPLRAVLPPTADRRPRRGTVERANAHGPPPLQTWRVVPQVCVPRFDARVGRRGWVEGERERRWRGQRERGEEMARKRTRRVAAALSTASLAKGGSTINRRALTVPDTSRTRQGTTQYDHLLLLLSLKPTVTASQPVGLVFTVVCAKNLAQHDTSAAAGRAAGRRQRSKCQVAAAAHPCCTAHTGREAQWWWCGNVAAGVENSNNQGLRHPTDALRAP